MKNGWNEGKKSCDHSQMMNYVLKLPIQSVEYVKNDCFKAYKSMPNGPKAGYYLDMSHYCGMRLRGNL